MYWNGQMMKRWTVRKKAKPGEERESDPPVDELFTATLLAGQKKALADRIDVETAAELLTRLRERGDARARASAKTKLCAGYTWLVYETAFLAGESWQRLAADDVIAAFYEGLDTSLDRLEDNDEHDVEKFVRDELWRTFQDWLDEQSFDLLVPSSTKSTREARGQAPYGNVARLENPDDEADIFAEMDAIPPYPYECPTTGPFETQEGEFRRVPSCMVSQHDGFELVDLFDQLDVYAPTDEEQSILLQAMDGVSRKDIAANQSTTLYRVNQVIAGVAERMLQAGAVPAHFIKPVLNVHDPLDTDAPLAIDDASNAVDAA